MNDVTCDKNKFTICPDCGEKMFLWREEHGISLTEYDMYYFWECDKCKFVIMYDDFPGFQKIS